MGPLHWMVAVIRSSDWPSGPPLRLAASDSNTPTPLQTLNRIRSRLMGPCAPAMLAAIVDAPEAVALQLSGSAISEGLQLPPPETLRKSTAAVLVQSLAALRLPEDQHTVEGSTSSSPPPPTDGFAQLRAQAAEALLLPLLQSLPAADALSGPSVILACPKAALTCVALAEITRW